MKRIDFMNPAPDCASSNGMRHVQSIRIDTEAGSVQEHSCLVVEESTLQLDVVNVGSYALTWSATENRGTTFGFNATTGVLADTPTPEILALCIGFLVTESLIENIGDIDAIVVAPASADVVRVWLKDRGRADDRAPHVPDTLRLWAAELVTHFAEMVSRQEMFRGAGGAHAAAAFSPEEGMVAIAEDLGRHNALDKVVGKCCLLGYPTGGCGVLVSSRINLQMVQKAARAGFELLAGVSAPSSLAIQAAQDAGMTLCGFVREGRITTFTHAHRLIRRPTPV